MRIFIFFSNIFSIFVRLFKANVGKVRILLTYFPMFLRYFSARIVKLCVVKYVLLSTFRLLIMHKLYYNEMTANYCYFLT